MKLLKRVLLGIGIILVIIQFIRPQRNTSGTNYDTDISKAINVPDSVQGILKKACYDCHSNNTVYPWYANVQPVGWFLARDIRLAKEDLNFSEFGSYPQRRQLSKITSIADEIDENAMPLPSYRLMHKNARLQPEEKKLLISWTEKFSKNRISE